MLFECGVTETKIQNYSKYYGQQYENRRNYTRICH